MGGKVAYQTYWEDHGVYWIYSGIVTEKEVLDSNHEFYQHQQSNKCHYQIIDALEVELFDFQNDAMVDLAALDSSHAIAGVTLKLAFIASDTKVLGVFDTYINYSKMLNNRWEMEVFDNVPEARAWLAI